MNSEDLIRWLIKIILNSSVKSKIYNVGSDEAISVESLAKIIAKKFDKKIKKINLNKNKLIDEIDYYVPSINKAKKDLNLKLKFNFNQSLNQLFKY